MTASPGDFRHTLLELSERERTTLLANMATATRTRSVSGHPYSLLRSLSSMVSSALQTASTPSASAHLGLGSLSGKALLWELRLLEWFIIQRKLASFAQHFPHDDSITLPSIKQIYDEVLELTRRVTTSSKIE
jgi:hypothetical protein